MSGGPYFDHAGVFLIHTLFGLYILALMLRFLLQTVRADFYNPLVQALVSITNPPLIPLRRFIPGLMGLDLAALALMLVLKLLEWFLVYNVVGRSVSFAGLLVMALADLFNLFLNALLWIIIIRVILSWLNPDYRQPIVSLIYQLSEPVMRPARNLIPAVGGFDLSPIAVLVLIQLSKILLVAPLWDLGNRLS